MRPAPAACWSLTLLMLLATLRSAVPDHAVTTPTSSGSTGHASSPIHKREDIEVSVSVKFLGEGYDGGGESAAAFGELVALELQRSGVRAKIVAAPGACNSPVAADARECLDATLSALAGGALHVAVLPVPADLAPAAWRLRDAGLEDLGDATPLARRACLATRPPARSLLDLVDVERAAIYNLASGDLERALYAAERKQNRRLISNDTYEPEWCDGLETDCATLLTSDAAETKVLSEVIRERRLRARVLALGSLLLPTLDALQSTASLVCDWSPKVSSTETLGPPPCTSSGICPFEARRVVKFANVRVLARSPRAIRALIRLSLNDTELRDLMRRARIDGPTAAARSWLAAHPARAPRGEVRVAVLVPNATRREAYDAPALAASAALAEESLDAEHMPREARLKVEVHDDRCATVDAYKYLIDALGTGEYGALSAVAGPACGSAFADVARQSPTHLLPVLAYTPQAPPAGTRYALLAGGDAQESSTALGAVLAHLNWRRLAVLSERGTRALLDPTRLQADFVHHVEFPDDHPDLDYRLIDQWANRVAALNGRIVLVCAEDARVVRAALCAGAAAGLTAAAGVVWLLPGTLPAGWLRPASGDVAPCSSDQLRRIAEGHLSVAPEWAVRWRDAIASDRIPHLRRWHEHCRHVNHDSAACNRPDAHAALLYDVLRLWAASLDRLLTARPAAVDDMHDPELVEALLENVTATDFEGATGRFEWIKKDGVRARVAPLIIEQWRNGSRYEIGRWTRGKLRLVMSALRWSTSDGASPDDGGEQCALQSMAEFLGTDCRVAWAMLGVLALAISLASLVAVALYCRRRIEREYRERLSALGLRTLPPKSLGLDRWEVPRERVVINRKLGMGAFGTVYGGHALLAENRGWTAVAVKTLKAGATTEEKLDFLSEAEAMKRFDHKNVVRLLGVVTKTEPVCTVMEFMLYGDLKSYLLARRHLAAPGAGGDADGEVGLDIADEVSPRRLTGMALDVARALSYLAQLRYVHRDVAARNCLVSARRVVKLADFGMTRLVFENDYYRFSRKGMLPVRWMAPESLTLGVFSPASDIWSFGVLLYEIVTFGSLPFQGFSNGEVLAQVKAGRTLDLPLGLKPQLEGLIKSCWQQDYKARPAASEVAAFLAEAPRLLTPCLDMPLDALPLSTAPDAAPVRWRRPTVQPDRAEARWLSWASPASAATDTTDLSADAPPPADTDSFLP